MAGRRAPTLPPVARDGRVTGARRRETLSSTRSWPPLCARIPPGTAGCCTTPCARQSACHIRRKCGPAEAHSRGRTASSKGSYHRLRRTASPVGTADGLLASCETERGAIWFTGSIPRARDLPDSSQVSEAYEHGAFGERALPHTMVRPPRRGGRQSSWPHHSTPLARLSRDQPSWPAAPADTSPRRRQPPESGQPSPLSRRRHR
jgi:hypothetical protein